MVAEVSITKLSLDWMPLDLTVTKSILVRSGNGLVPSGNKPLPQQAITWADVDRDVCLQMAWLGLNELGMNEPIWHMT